MSETGVPANRRAQLVCLTGFFFQAILFGVVLSVGLWSDSDAVIAGARHLLGGIPIWVILFIVFMQRSRSFSENLETEELQRAQEAGLATSMFDVADESMLLERRRLNWTMKYLLPGFTVLLAVYHIGGTFILWPWSLGLNLKAAEWQRAADPFVPMVFMGGVAFCCFVFARYVVGMSRRPEWQLLRAGGSYLIGNALTASLLVVAMAMAGNETTGAWAEPLAAYVIRISVLLLGMEFLTNFILDFYRPRRAGEEIRPAFSSRLLSLFSEPGGIMRSVADTVNYQFGFEVSGTWFYQLLRRSVLPLTMMTALVLIGLSTVVILDVDEHAVIVRFGRRVQAADETLGPGIHLKFPWPIDRIARARTEQVRSLTVGITEDAEHAMEERDAAHAGEDETQHALLWTEEHSFNAETMMIVGNTTTDSTAFENASGKEAKRTVGSGSIAVNLLMVSMATEYRIKDLDDFLFHYVEPERVLSSIAMQELSDYASSVDMSVMMGRGREPFGPRMTRILQDRCDELGLGIEITFVALQDAHPPSQSDVARTFQNVVAAEIRKSATIVEAAGLADRTLTLAAGSVARAKALDEAVLEMDRLSIEAERLNTAELKEAAGEAAVRVDDLLFGNPSKGVPAPSGEVASVIEGARGDRAAAIGRAESKTRTHQNDLVAYRASPKLFMTRRYLDMLRRTLPLLRKYVVTGDNSNLIIEYETVKGAALDLETVEPPP